MIMKRKEIIEIVCNVCGIKKDSFVWDDYYGKRVEDGGYNRRRLKFWFVRRGEDVVKELNEKLKGVVMEGKRSYEIERVGVNSGEGGWGECMGGDICIYLKLKN